MRLYRDGNRCSIIQKSRWIWPKHDEGGRKERKREKERMDDEIRGGWKDQREKRTGVCSTLCPLVASGLFFQLDNPQHFTPFVTSSSLTFSTVPFFNHHGRAGPMRISRVSAQTKVYRELNEVHRDLCSGFTSQISAGRAFSLYNGTMDYTLRPRIRNIDNIVERAEGR